MGDPWVTHDERSMGDVDDPWVTHECSMGDPWPRLRSLTGDLRLTHRWRTDDSWTTHWHIMFIHGRPPADPQRTQGWSS